MFLMHFRFMQNEEREERNRRKRENKEGVLTLKNKKAIFFHFFIFLSFVFNNIVNTTA